MISNENILGESRMEEMHRQMARFSGWGWGEGGWINHCWKTLSYKVWIADKLQAGGQEKQETNRKVLVFWKSGEKKHYKEGKTGISMTKSITKFCLEPILSSRYWVSKMDWGWGNRGWHHQLKDMSLSKLGVGDGQRSLACCSPWGCRVRHDSSNLASTHSWLV